MNKKIILFLNIVALGLGMFSCTDVTNLNNTTEISDQAIWSTEEAAEMYITASYKTFTDVSQVANSRTTYYDSFSDLMKSTSWDQYNHPYNKALLQASAFSTGSAGCFECWSGSADDNTIAYSRIRRANVLLDEINRYGVKSFGEDWCNIRRAEVRLCRAFSYYRLIRVYGGVVIRTDVSGVNGGVDDGSNPADISRARASEADSWSFVISELQWAAQYLPDSWTTEWNGRATKKTAYGLISRMALYAQQWQTAIDAAEKVKELGGALASDYAKVFQVDGGQDNSSEILFALYFAKGTVMHHFDEYNRPFGDDAALSTTVYGEQVPTAELSDLYEFKDGTPFDWSTYSASHTDPYTDREPRFQATVMYNGCQWEGREIQTYVGGSDGYVDFTQSSSTNGHTCTGYYLRKYLQEGYKNFVTDGGSYQYDAVLRYAEVLLNKAEAYAQLDYNQYRDQALEAMNEVRNRVGLPSKTASDAPDLNSFLTLLRKERCVELAGEGFRYWDLRRWKLAESVINGQNAHGVKITKNDDGTFSYERVACDGGTSRIFLNKYYYFSLPSSELASNKLCVNNPYW